MTPTRVFPLFAIALLGLSLISASCNAQKKAVGKADFTSVSLRQGGCFGTCPVFTMDISSAGAVTYVGQQYAPYRGLHNGRLNADTLTLVRRLTAQVLAKAESLPRNINTGIVDHSQSVVTILTSAGDTIAFTGTTEFAPPVDALREVLARVPQNTELIRNPKAGPAPADQLLLTLKAGDQIQALTENYYRQQLKVVRMTSKEPAVFLMSFDPFTMSAEEMERDLRRNAAVIKVEVVEASN